MFSVGFFPLVILFPYMWPFFARSPCLIITRPCYGIYYYVFIKWCARTNRFDRPPPEVSVSGPADVTAFRASPGRGPLVGR